MTAEFVGRDNINESLLCIATGQPCPAKVAIDVQLARDIALQTAGTTAHEYINIDDDDWNGEEMYPRTEAAHQAGPVELSLVAAIRKKEYDQYVKRRGCSGEINSGTIAADCPTRIILANNPNRADFLRLIRKITKRV